MKLSNRVKPISYLKANAPKVIEELEQGAPPLIITVNGEAKAILQDIESYEKTQETLALLKILALGEKDLAEGRVKPDREVFARTRKKSKV
jgi:prevent-host-death family protein